MSPTLGRLAAFIIAALAFAASSVSSPNSGSEAGLSLAPGESTHQNTWADPVPGTKPLFGLQERTLDVGRRDCLANGTNYCFGNNVDFCPGCGNCCVDGKYCCGGGKVCCGSGCCSSDQVCSQGKCVASVEPVTVTSTITQTLTRIATQRATVVIAEVQTSTSISTVDITLSTAATQTDIVWVTTTAVAKRAAVSPKLPQPSRGDVLLASGSSRLRPSKQWETVKNGLSHIFRDAPIPRQESQGATSVVTNYVTQTTEVTSTSSVIVTTHHTSTHLTTVYQTNTRVLKAEVTITLTSTLTLTSRPPSVITLTTTANLVLPTPSKSTPPSSATPELDPSQLSTSAIAGIAAGSSAFALVIAGLIIIFSIRRRRHRRARSETPPPFAYDHPYPGTDLTEMQYTTTSTRTSMGKRQSPRTSHSLRTRQRQQQPTLPPVSVSVLPHFATTTAPAHHAADFHLPPSLAAQRAQPGGAGHLAAAGQGHRAHGQRYGHVHGLGQGPVPQSQWRMGHHQRNSSGFTTLVGTPSPTAAVFGFGSGLGMAKKEDQCPQQFNMSPGEGPVFELGGDGVVRELEGEGVARVC